MLEFRTKWTLKTITEEATDYGSNEVPDIDIGEYCASRWMIEFSKLGRRINAVVHRQLDT
jgi:hypothetical protein